jgi:FtsZ-binding cell division protein ZapB
MEIAEKQKNGRANEKQHRQQQKQNMESKSNQLSNENSTTFDGLKLLSKFKAPRLTLNFLCMYWISE